jgi:putative transposase
VCQQDELAARCRRIEQVIIADPFAQTRLCCAKRIRQIAETRVRYGYRRIHVVLKREGWQVNVKRVRRIYNLEGLQMRHKPPRRRIMAKLRDDRSNATGPNQVWAMDWMHDELFDGKRIWVLTVVDTWSRICPVMRVTRSATALVVIAALEEARQRFGLPHTIRVDQSCSIHLEGTRLVGLYQWHHT